MGDEIFFKTEFTLEGKMDGMTVIFSSRVYFKRKNGQWNSFKIGLLLNERLITVLF